MNKQDIETMHAELEQRFPGLTIKTNYSLEADYASHSFVEKGKVIIWQDNVCVQVITSQKELDAFLTVVRIMAQGQLETIGTHTGECIECERVSTLSDASNLCEACTIDLTTKSLQTFELRSNYTC